MSVVALDQSLETLAERPRQVVEPLCGASRRAGLGGLAARLAEVQAWMQDGLQDLERELETVARADGDLSRRAARHLLERPGKRIRPLCVLLGAELAAVPIDDRVRDLAVAAEIVHAATLLHDDVIDDGHERRGAPAARIVYGNSASILGGDYLLVEALERVAALDAAPVLRSLLDTIARMVAAEAVQLERRGRFEPCRDTYLQIIEGKTASLFRWALAAAPLLGGMSPAHLARLERAGTSLGLAFQLVDDALDLEGDPQALGKDPLADLRQGKLTWPLLRAAELDPAFAAELARLAGPEPLPLPPEEALAQVVARVRALGTIDETRALADAHRRSARAALSALPPTAARDAICLVVDAAVERRR